MKLPRRRFLHLAASAAALPVMSRIATAQTYPSRPITIIVPYPTGGPTDTIARLLGERPPSRNLIGALMELQRHSSPRLHSLCLEYGGGWWAGEKMYENSGSFDFFGRSGNGGGE